MKKAFTRRLPDSMPQLRRYVQVAFLLLNLWIGARFYFFVRYCETGGATTYVPRPPGIEGWLPIAGLMNLKYTALTRVLPEVHAPGFFLFVAFLGMSLALRKSFCSWLCPVGTISEWLWEGGREIFKRNVAAPRWLDVPLRSLKYLVFAFFAWAILNMPVDAIQDFLGSPYGLIADVKLLNFFRTLGEGAALTIAVLVVGSIFVKNLWCRYLCPYGALLGLASFFSPVRIVRDAATCIDCDKCDKACPSIIPVASLKTVRTVECTGCLECVAACPVSGALDLKVIGTKRVVPRWAMAAGVLLIFFGLVGFARVTGRWRQAVPDEVYLQLVPQADRFGH